MIIDELASQSVCFSSSSYPSGSIGAGYRTRTCVRAEHLPCTLLLPDYPPQVWSIRALPILPTLAIRSSNVTRNYEESISRSIGLGAPTMLSIAQTLCAAQGFLPHLDATVCIVSAEQAGQIVQCRMHINIWLLRLRIVVLFLLRCWISA